MVLNAVDSSIYSLPEEERRKRLVAVAQDVIKQLDARKYIASPGTYVSWPISFYQPSTGPSTAEELQQFVQKLGNEKCEACAIGTAFLSYVNLYDSITPGKNDTQAWTNLDPREEMISIFGTMRMGMMEAVFELWGAGSVDALNGAEWDKIEAFIDELPNELRRETLCVTEEVDTCEDPDCEHESDKEAAEGRLRLIMEQVIREGGTFLGV